MGCLGVRRLRFTFGAADRWAFQRPDPESSGSPDQVGWELGVAL